MRRPGIEPRSTAWKAAMLTTSPPTFPVVKKLCAKIFEMLNRNNNGYSFQTGEIPAPAPENGI